MNSKLTVENFRAREFFSSLSAAAVDVQNSSSRMTLSLSALKVVDSDCKL